MKQYLGDGVYAELDSQIPGMLKLTTSDGMTDIHVIWLESDVVAALEEFLKVNKNKI